MKSFARTEQIKRKVTRKREKEIDTENRITLMLLKFHESFELVSSPSSVSINETNAFYTACTVRTTR